MARITRTARSLVAAAALVVVAGVVPAHAQTVNNPYPIVPGAADGVLVSSGTTPTAPTTPPTAAPAKSDAPTVKVEGASVTTVVPVAAPAVATQGGQVAAGVVSFTGAQSGMLATIAAALVAAGTALLVVTKRRRPARVATPAS